MHTGGGDVNAHFITDSLSHTMYVEINKVYIMSKCIEVYEGFRTSV